MTATARRIRLDLAYDGTGFHGYRNIRLSYAADPIEADAATIQSGGFVADAAPPTPAAPVGAPGA